MSELYLCARLTENEHYLWMEEVEDECKALNLEMRYYRKLKEGHVPLWREVKVVGEQSQVNLFKKNFRRGQKWWWMKESLGRNPHK